MEENPCPRKRQNITKRHQNIILMRHVTMEKRPNIMRGDNTKRLRITPTRPEPMQSTPEDILRRP
jgi:hypothetical protein